MATQNKFTQTGPTSQYMMSPYKSETVTTTGGGDGGKMSVGGSSSQSREFFSDPNQASRLQSIMEGLIGGAGQDYLEFIRNPTASPYFQNAYAGILAALQPQEAQQRNELTDRFRAAGGGAGMGGGAHQVAAGQMEAEINRNQMAGLTQLLTTLFPQVTNALFAPIGETDAILNAMKLQESEQSSFNFSGDMGDQFMDPYTNSEQRGKQFKKNMRDFMGGNVMDIVGGMGNLF